MYTAKMYRSNGECVKVKSFPTDHPIDDAARELYHKYMGDVNRRLDPRLSVVDPDTVTVGMAPHMKVKREAYIGPSICDEL